MVKAKVSAFLLCENATKGRDDKATLHRRFDTIIIPRTHSRDWLFFVYYKSMVNEACVVPLRMMHSSGQEIEGNWRDTLSYVGAAQSI
jgi:hypothetical protein